VNRCRGRELGSVTASDAGHTDGEAKVAYKDLLLYLNSYPEVTSAASIEQGVRFAGLLGARLSALTFEIDIRVPTNPLALTILDIPGMVAAERSKSIDNARDLLNVFDTSAAKHGVSSDHVIERSPASHIPDLVTEYARLRDVTLIPVGEPGGFQRYVAEGVIFGSGRPVLILPGTPKRRAEIELGRIGVAWDFSRPAARAVADALPLLQRAKTVHIVTITNEKTIDTSRSGSELARHLAYHGVQVVLEEEDARGRTISQALEAYAVARDLDILVMGAYGHSRVRDFILGGATKNMISAPPLPILLSH
jgi:nucleotide-binding universal stress UspA family protein